MLPFAGRQVKAYSPSNRMKSTHLPYFKRFPNHRFLSQEKRQLEDPKTKKFFTEGIEVQEKTPTNKIYSTPGIRQLRESKIALKFKPRQMKQFYQNQSIKRKRTSEFIESSIIERSHSLAKRKLLSDFLTPEQVLRLHKHRLSPYEMTEIMQYSEIYYYGQNCTNKNEIATEVECYPWSKGNHVAYRYQFVELLGEGSFGQVFKCIDHRCKKQLVALKIVKNNQKYALQAKVQINILNFIKSKDIDDSKNCILLKDHFIFRNQTCMTFSMMSLNLYELIKSNGYYGLPLDLIRRFVLQILNAVHFLHKNKIIHADLKPQNILLKEQSKSGVKVIDFGSSCWEGETVYSYIQSRYYRAPQVILGMPYNQKIDIWSLGCIIAELHLGYPLFAGQDEHEQMCLIVEVLGLPPKELVPSSKRWHVFFDSRHNLKHHEKRKPPQSKTLKKALQHVEDSFVQFIRACLVWDPDQRLEAIALLKNQWVMQDLPQDFKLQHLKFIQDEERDQIRKKSTLRIREKTKRE